MTDTMLPSQLALARHALGLPNKRRVSYRNRYCLYGKGEPWLAWMGLVSKGLATYDDDGVITVNGPRLFFSLTRKGAEAALKRGERLCPEDFP